MRAMRQNAFFVFITRRQILAFQWRVVIYIIIKRWHAYLQVNQQYGCRQQNINDFSIHFYLKIFIFKFLSIFIKLFKKKNFVIVNYILCALIDEKRFKDKN